jgi:hypothetical protein
MGWEDGWKPANEKEQSGSFDPEESAEIQMSGMQWADDAA